VPAPLPGYADPQHPRKILHRNLCTAEAKVIDLIQVMTTIDSREEAQNIARALVQGRLAGCVQIIGPITSVYWWREQIETDEEWLCIAKSRQELYPQLEKTIRQIHPYDVPEILAMPVVAGNPDYLAWLTNELQR